MRYIRGKDHKPKKKDAVNLRLSAVIFKVIKKKVRKIFEICVMKPGRVNVRIPNVIESVRYIFTRLIFVKFMAALQ